MKNKKFKIAMIGQKRVPSREGGIEVVVEELAIRMVQMGHEVTCYNRRGHHICGSEFDAPEMSEYKGIKLKKVFTIARKGFAAVTASISSSICVAFGRYDIVHFHAEGSCVLLWLPKLLGKRCIVTVHGLDHQREKWRKWASAYILLGEKVAVKFADEIIVLSKANQNYFKSVYGRETHYISNGVNRPQFQSCELINQYYGLVKDDYILSLGRLVPEKGLVYLVKAYKNIKTNKKLVIAGGASDTDEFANELRKLASDDKRIIFTGFVQGKMLEELYSNAYIYTLTSDLEGMPLSLLEAMSYGNCCLVSDIPECLEVVEDKAVVFKCGNGESLREQLQMLCDNEKIVGKYKANVADFVCSKYDWDMITEQTLQLYRK